MKLSTPYAGLLPPLSTQEFDALATSIMAEGVRNAVLVTEDGRVLDGHNRLDIDENSPTAIIHGSSSWNDDECKAFIIRCNLERRNLSPDQKKNIYRLMRSSAERLKKSDPKRFTQEVLAMMFGVSQQTVSYWFSSNTSAGITTKPLPFMDSRVKVNPAERGTIYERCEVKGESQAQVAADYGVNQTRISQIVIAEKKAIEQKSHLDTVIQSLKGEDLGIITGDFREIGSRVDDESVQLIFTDPPYDGDSVILYEHLAEFASRVLIPGGLCMAYTGQTYLSEILNGMAKHLEYMWTFAIQHKGGDLRFRKWKLQNKWKPIVCFGKPKIEPWWDWTFDMVSGGKEKDTHEWQQAVSEASYFIERFSMPGALVCEPFCGGGTTCVAAKNAGRKFVAFEVNEESANKARARILNDTQEGQI